MEDGIKGDVAELRRRLGTFVRRFERCIKTRPSREHMRTYLAGQVGSLPRKSIEPIALEAGVPPRTLQEFLGLHRWDEQALQRKVQEIIMRDHADENAIGVIDETSFPKKGTETTGVQRQYCGASGKIDNCVVSVHLGYSAGDFFALADSDLYLPQESWAMDARRREKAGIPETVTFRPKWRIALDLLNRSIGNGMRFGYLTADEEYGRCAAFRRGVAKQAITYAVEIPCSMRGWTRMPPMRGSEKHVGRGRQATRERLAEDAPSSRRVDDVWRRGGPSWNAFHIKDTGNGPVVWEARVTRFHLWEDGGPGEEGWLIVARNVLDGEVKYFFSNAPADAAIETLLAVAFHRWCIERLFEDAKGQVGMDHFEVRRYRPLIRHLILSMVSMLFLVKETDRLRGKKSVVERVTGARGNRGATRSGCFAHGTSPTDSPCVGQNCVLAGIRSEGGHFAPEGKTAKTTSHGHLCFQN